MKTILLLDGNDGRIKRFRETISKLGADFDLKIWGDARSMRAESEFYFAGAALISLSYGDSPKPWETGLDAAKFLAECSPVCPVIIHSTDPDHACSMENEFRFTDWIVEQVSEVGRDCIETAWMSKAARFLSAHPNTWPANLPADHEERMRWALLSLDGLSVGDGFGERFFTKPEVIERRLEYRDPPPSPWSVTDDTITALSIVRCLKRYGHIERDALAMGFAREYAREPHRGYGGTAHGILRSIGEGTPWQTAAGRVFDGQGSCGNGGAMRAAPIGAYFADDLTRVVAEARSSAEITHAHPDGQSGAIAVALAAARMVREQPLFGKPGFALIEFVLERLPRTDTYYII